MVITAQSLVPGNTARLASPTAQSSNPQEVFSRSGEKDWKAPTMAEMTRAVQSSPTLPDGKTVAWGDFALGRHKPGTGYSYFKGTNAELIDLVSSHWDERKPGVGRTNLEEVVAVPVPADRFMSTTVEVQPDSELSAQLYRRRDHEEPYVRVTSAGEAQPARHAQVILYSRDTLGKNDERSREADWEVVSLVASPVENEPMDPVTMMRNMRGKAGGTEVKYSAEQLLDSIDFWSRHVKIQPK